jgi:ABC-2 type transport system ATP-binding protein
MTPTILATGLTRCYRDQAALDDVSLEVVPDAITGLLGRNGAGKTTLMRIVTAQEFATSGRVLVFGQNPVENDGVLRRIAFIREDQVYPDFRVARALEVASWFYPNWDHDLAALLLADFDLPPGRLMKKLSRGMRSAVGIIIGLAARADLTLFDEPYAGLDPVARRIFYDRLLADFADHPRTVVLSTHLVDEVADLLERVVILDRGRVVVDAPIDEVRGGAFTVRGPASAVAQFVSGRRVWHRQALGSRAVVTAAGRLDAAERARAAALHLSVEPLSLQELLVHATAGVTREKVIA